MSQARFHLALLALVLVPKIGSADCSGLVNYCTASPNSVGSGALISWTGTPSSADDDFHLVVTGCPANQPVLFYYGGAQNAVPFGNGVRCVATGGSGIYRFQPMQADGSGTASMKVDFGQAPVGAGPGMWSPGETWYCQGWYRDPAAGGAAFNLTDGLEVRVCMGSGAYAGTVLVPGGSFEMGRHVGGGDVDELPVHTVVLNAFYMDVFEVSNQEYADYLNTALAQGRITVSSGFVYQVGGAGLVLCDTTAGHSNNSRITWHGSTFGVTAGKQAHPMVEVSWYGACAYANGRSRAEGLTPAYNETTWDCDFNADGYRLPTEAEWEYAARGGEQSPYYMYPWGDLIDGSKANYANSNDSYEKTGSYPWTTPAGYFDGSQTPQGTDMVNGYGLYDMAGNAWEMCHDRYSHIYYSTSPVDNPTGPLSGGGGRVLRGGSWGNYSPYLRAAARAVFDPAGRDRKVGFRVVAVSP